MIKREIFNISEDLKRINEYIYNNPELPHEEYKACEILVDFLKEHNFIVEENYLNFDTAFKAVYDSKKPGPTISYLAEYDALPDIGHACGHNNIAILSVGAGIVLSKFIDEIGGRVIVLGTPAEETDGVKVDMVKAGTFDDIDIAMLVHPESRFMVSGSSLAVDRLKFSFKGKASHAAASPYNGINALDAMINAFVSINLLREQVRETSRIHGIITEGGKAVNIIPDYTEAKFSIRSERTDYNKKLVERVKNCIKAAALATSCEYEIMEDGNSYAAMNTNERLYEIYENNLKSLDVEYIDNKKDIASSIDMGDVSKVVPAIHPYVGIVEKNRKRVPIHSEYFSRETISDYAYKNIFIALEALVKTGIDIIKDEKLLDEINKEFKG